MKQLSNMGNKVIYFKQSKHTYKHFCFLFKLEKKCFGWKYADEHYDSGDDKTTLVYCRPAGYSKNILFIITELLSNLCSGLRMIILYFSILPLVASIMNPYLALAVIGINVGMFVISLILCLLGLILRKLFRLTKK